MGINNTSSSPHHECTCANGQKGNHQFSLFIAGSEVESEKLYFYDKAAGRDKSESIFLNNFAESPLLIDGERYRTVEHYYQVIDARKHKNRR